MKKGWEEKYLKDISEYSIGLTYKPTHVCEDGTIVLRSSNIQGGKLDLSDIVRVNAQIKDKLYVQPGDILMCSRNGSAKLVGKVCLIPEMKEPMTYGTFMMIIRSQYNPLLYYFFDSNDFRKQIKHGEANMINQITRYMLDDVKVKFPPLSEQKEIVEYLDSSFAKIDKLKENAAKNLEEAKALFQSALKNALEPKEGWEEKKMVEVCTIERGGSPRPIKKFLTKEENGLNWIKIGDTDPQGKYIYSTAEKIIPEGLKKSRWVDVDDFLLSNSMSFGRPYILKTNGCIHDGWLVLRNYQNFMNIDFFYYLLVSPLVQRQFKIKAQGSTVSNLNTQRVADVAIYIPPLPEQQSIVSFLDSLNEKLNTLQQNYSRICDECDALKQAILRQVFE